MSTTSCTDTGKSQSTTSRWGTQAMRRRAFEADWPKSDTVPLTSGTMPRMALSSVLLPPPLGPMTPMTCPRSMSAETPRRTTWRS
jgi:hypothetical protein